MSEYNFRKLKRYGIIFIVSGPSGAGKSSICRKIIEEDENLFFSVSCTTRKPRRGEKNDIDYKFVSIEDFKKLIEENAFLEYAKVHDNYYGTLKNEVLKRIENGNDVLLDIDVQGALNIKASSDKNQLIKECSEYIFITPPDCVELERRLRGRGTDTEKVVQRRLKNAKGELAECMKYDFLIVNDSLPEAIENLKSLIAALRKKTTRLHGVV